MGRSGRGPSPCVLDLSVDIPAPAAAVWDFLADVQDAEPIPGAPRVRMSKEPLGPTTVGTRWHEYVRFAPGLWMHVESVATQAERPHLLAMAFDSRWWSGHLRYEIVDTGLGSELHHRETLVPRRVLRPWSRWIEHRLRDAVQQRLLDIRDAVVRGKNPSTSRPRRNGEAVRDARSPLRPRRAR